MSSRRNQNRTLQRLCEQVKAIALNSNVASGRGGRRARKPRTRTRRTNAGQVIPPPGQPGMPRSSNPRRRNAGIVGGEGHMRISRDELCRAVTTGTTGDVAVSIKLLPSSECLAWLSSLAGAWDRIVWHSIRVSWRAAVGTTTDGMVAYGLHWNPSRATAAPTRAQVTACCPVKDHPIWQSTDSAPLVASAGSLQSRPFYTLRATDIAETTPCTIYLNVMGGPASKQVGEVWIHYDVTLTGPVA